MYLHIGKEKIIKKKDLICILDIESLKNNDKINNIIKKLEEENNIECLSDNKKSLILINEEEKVKGYISNISSTTLAKRT